MRSGWVNYFEHKRVNFGERQRKEYFKVFGLIDSAEIVRETREGRMQDVEVTLSDWVFDAIENNHVLTLSRRYFFSGSH